MYSADNLDKKIISDLISENDISVSVFPSLPSTNDFAKELALDGAKEKTLILAENQTAGRGRTGKQFFSPSGSGVYLSLILRPVFPPSESYKITLSAAVALCETLEAMGVSPSIKWVNDIFLGGRKVAGILTEAKLNNTAEKISYAVLGVGINLYPPSYGFPDDISSIAGYIWEKPMNNRKNQLVALFINNFLKIYKNSFSNLIDDYRRRCFILGKKILVLKQGEKKSATALNITDNGGLKIIFENGEEAVLDSGEISIKPL